MFNEKYKSSGLYHFNHIHILEFNDVFSLNMGNNNGTPFFLRKLVNYCKSRTLWTLNVFKCKIESENNRSLMNSISEVSFKLLVLLSYVWLVLWKKRNFWPTKIFSFGKQNCIHLCNHSSRFLVIICIRGTHYVPVIQVFIFLIQNLLDCKCQSVLWWFNRCSLCVTISLIVLLSNSFLLPK